MDFLFLQEGAFLLGLNSNFSFGLAKFTFLFLNRSNLVFCLYWYCHKDAMDMVIILMDQSQESTNTRRPFFMANLPFPVEVLVGGIGK